MVLEIAHTLIKYKFITDEMKYRCKKYAVDKEADFYVESIIVDDFFDLSDKKISLENKYYRIYKEADKIIQVQFENGVVIGMIEYYQDKVLCYMKKENCYIVEYLLTEYATLYFILKYQEAIFIHSSCFVYKDAGVLLIATSGTGKSTHARLWKEYENVIQLNDDKNIILKEGDDLIIYPNPYSGKHAIDTNIKVKLKYVVFVNRKETNEVKLLSSKHKFFKLLPHVMTTSFIYDSKKWDRMTSELVEKTVGLDLYCNISHEAQLTLKSALEEHYENKSTLYS